MEPKQHIVNGASYPCRADTPEECDGCVLEWQEAMENSDDRDYNEEGYDYSEADYARALADEQDLTEDLWNLK